MFQPPQPPGRAQGCQRFGELTLESWWQAAPWSRFPVEAWELVTLARRNAELYGYVKGWVFRPHSARVSPRTLVAASALVSSDASATCEYLLGAYQPAYAPLPPLLASHPWLHLDALEVPKPHQGTGAGTQLLRAALAFAKRHADIGLVSLNAYPLEYATGWAGEQPVSWARQAAHVHSQFVLAQARLAQFYERALGAQMVGNSLQMVAGASSELAVLHHPSTQRWTLAPATR